MAKFTFADGTVFEGTAAELAEYTRLAGGAAQEQPQEIEGPVRVGDTVEVTLAFSRFFTEGRRYVVEKVLSGGEPYVRDDCGGHSAMWATKYRIVARKAETPEPAKPLPKVGDYVVFDEDGIDVTAGKTYQIVDVGDDDAVFRVIDDASDAQHFGVDADYRIITDARELAFAKAGRKLDEFKAGDFVRFNTNTGGSGYTRGTIAEVEKVDEDGYFSFGKYLTSPPRWAELIAPAEARVDSE